MADDGGQKAGSDKFRKQKAEINFSISAFPCRVEATRRRKLLIVSLRRAAFNGFDNCGKSHHSEAMPTLTLDRPGRKQRLTVLENYDVAADAKKRISLRQARTKYFHVQALSNGCFYLEPRVLVSPRAISARSLKMLDKSAANLKKGLASAPIDLAALVEA
jgi:hypothetical protein